MDPDTFFANVDPQQPAYLLLTQPDGQMAPFALDANNSFFAGTGPSCRMVLGGADVHPIHCMFWLNESGVLCVQDWNTNGRTLLNHDPIDSEAALQSGDEIMVGGNLIIPVLTRECHVRAVSRLASYLESSESPSEDPILATSNLESPATPPPEEIDDRQAMELAMEQDPLPPSQPSEPSNLQDSGFQYDANADWDDRFSDDDPSTGFTFAPAVFDGTNDLSGERGFSDAPSSQDSSEEVELLRLEVEQLRFELGERQSRLPIRDTTLDDGTPVADNEDQTLRLVNRLEELLVELQASDERTHELEELLRVSDQATQAEKEERQQLEAWVTEIEQRVVQREEESEAEMGRVIERLQSAQSQRDHVEDQLKKVLESKSESVDESSQALVQNLQIQAADLQTRLAESDTENATLRQSVRDQAGEAPIAGELKEMEQKLLDAQVAASRERAEMARQRAELQQMKDELDSKLKSARDLGSADSRVQAMRQHLREIHAQEQLELKEKRERSLGGRISKLLNRVGH